METTYFGNNYKERKTKLRYVSKFDVMICFKIKLANQDFFYLKIILSVRYGQVKSYLCSLSKHHDSNVNIIISTSSLQTNKLSQY